MVLQEAAALWNSRALVWMLTKRELAARHAGTAAGFIWLYIQPLLTIAAYYFVFDIVFQMRLSEKAPTTRVGAFLIAGSLPWMAFCDALSRGMNSLLDAGNLLQKNSLPAVIFPARAILASAIVYGPLVILLILIYGSLHNFGVALIALLPLMAMQLFLCFLLGYILAIFAAALRDTIQVIGFMLSVGIFCVPVLFPLSMFPESWQWILWINPATSLVVGYQKILLQGLWPPPNSWLFIFLWIIGLTFVLDAVLKRSRDQLVDWL